MEITDGIEYIVNGLQIEYEEKENQSPSWKQIAKTKKLKNCDDTGKLTFEEFKIYVESHIIEYLPEGFDKADVSSFEVIKNNGYICNAIIVRGEQVAAFPMLYLDELYKRYKAEGNLDVIVENLAQMVVKANIPEELEVYAANFGNFASIKDKIFAVVVNEYMNRDFFCRLPNKRLAGDLIAIYKVRMDLGKQGIFTCTILNQHKDMWGISNEELYELAMKNTERFMPAKIASADETVKNLLGCDMDLVNNMAVVSNVSGVYGAGVIFYKNNILNTLAKRFGQRMYIIPLNVHKVIVLRDDYKDIRSLSAMIRNIIAERMSITDILSEQIYAFDTETQKITLADKELQELLELQGIVECVSEETIRDELTRKNKGRR